MVSADERRKRDREKHENGRVSYLTAFAKLPVNLQ
jgi:hypothetical protein